MLVGYVYLAVYCIILFVLSLILGKYIANVFIGKYKFMGIIERPLYRLIQTVNKMSWKEYLFGLLLFNFLGFCLLLILQLSQAYLPLNPQHFGAPKISLAINTAISFITNTDWQAYTPERSIGYFTQMMGFAVENFLSAATGLVVLLVLIRGFIHFEKSTIGNVWKDLIRITLYILLPLPFIFAIVLIYNGSPQNFNQYTIVHTIEQQLHHSQITQTIPQGPVASQEAIKIVGTNGGGFFNANSAHPYENPNAITNFLQSLFILLIPGSLCFTFGLMVKDRRQGYTLFFAVMLVFVCLTAFLMHVEMHGSSFMNLKVDSAMNHLQSGGNMEGKDTRFGIFGSTLFSSATTAASCGATNSSLDSFLPLGGLVPMLFIQLDEIIFGGVGSGLYALLIYVLLSVFIAGLMIGRTPEYLGKKIESFEMKMVVIIVLIIPLLILISTAVSLVLPAGLNGLTTNSGPHGLSEILYAFSSTTHNNGSSFAGLDGSSSYYNYLTAFDMLIGRFGVIACVIALASRLASKKRIPVTSGTLPTHGVLFVIILICVIFIVSALTYVPALALGPIVEHLILFNS
jgi:K+-transporting ATPase ATPase A chain